MSLDSDCYSLTIYDKTFIGLSYRLTAAHIILVNCSVSVLEICDAAALILSRLQYLLKQVAISFVYRHVVQNDSCSYICVGCR